MALVTTLSSIVSSPTFRRRLPLVAGAFCVLSLGFSNLTPPLSLSSKSTGSAHSLPFFRSVSGSGTPAKSFRSVRMEASDKTVPSIVVYVTVPNREAGKIFVGSLSEAKHPKTVVTPIKPSSYEMALVTTLSSIVSSPTFRRRLPLVAGAFCVLSLGFSNLTPPLSLSSKSTGSAHSLPFFRSVSGSGTPAKSFRSVRMEASDKTVPSIVVYVTVPNREAGKKLAGSIVKEKLAACVNIVPGVESVYQWQGEIQTDSEELLIIKTRESLLEALTEHVKANHEYEVPEVISLPITGGSIPYLEWLKNSTSE